MSACNALKRNGHPCRGYANHSTGVCHMHMRFFEPTHFFTFAKRCCDPWQTHEERDWLIRAMRSKSFRNDPYYAEMISSMAADPPPGTWRAGSAIYLYEVFVKAGVIAPCTNPRIWRHYIKNRLDVLRYTAPHNRTEPMMTLITNEFFKPFFVNTPINKTLAYVFRYIAHTDRRFGNTITDAMWPFIISAILVSVPPQQLITLNREEFFKAVDGFAKQPAAHSNVWSGHLKQRLTDMVNASWEVARNMVRIKADPLKEEIVAAGWHPDRFLRWCVDVEELADMHAGWGLPMP
jgi:hypothetical protein